MSNIQDKFTSNSAVLSGVLPWTAKVRPWHVLITSVNVTLANHLVGELLVKHRLGRTAASVSEGVNAGVVTLLTSRLLRDMHVGPLGTMAAAGAVGVKEWFMRTYLEDPDDPVPTIRRMEPTQATELLTTRGRDPSRRAITVKRQNSRTEPANMRSPGSTTNGHLAAAQEDDVDAGEWRGSDSY